MQAILWEEETMRRPAGAVHSTSLSPTPLIVALLAVLAGLPTAQAQSSRDAAGQDPTTLDQVQVTGIRESMQSSINKKRDDTVIADVLSADDIRSEEHSSELQAQSNLVCRLLLEKK